MKLFLLVMSLVGAQIVGRGTQTTARVLTLRDVEASVRAVGFTYIVLPGTSIVEAGPGASIAAFIRVFPSAYAIAHSPAIASAERDFPRAHSRDIKVCNVWVSPYTYWGFGVDKPPVYTAVRAAQRIAAQLRRRC